MRQRSGFTLVELSIVLVIIGLLIGGILTAQSMINTAKISATVRQIGQFDAMVLNFKTKYNYLPGDAPAFGGDGDGVLDITAISGFDDHADVFACEIANFWNNLDSSQFPGASPCVNGGTNINLAGASKNVPVAKIGDNNSFFIADSQSIDSTSNLVDKANPRTYYVILSSKQPTPVYGWQAFAPTTSSNSALKTSEMLALDTKMDDGKGNSGNFISGVITAETACSNLCGMPYPAPLSTCSDGSGVYQIQNPGYECTPLIRIGGSVGVPQ